MKQIILITFIFSSFHMIAQKNHIKQISFNGENYWKYESVDIHNNTPFAFPPSGYSQFPKDGKWISYFEEDTSKAASIFEVRNVMLDGKSIQFRLNGSKLSEYNFLKGEQNGYERYWNKNGILVSEYQYEYRDYGHYKSSIRIGQWKDWNNRGNLITIRNFKDNKLHGRQLKFSKNGRIKNVDFYENGIKKTNSK